MHMASEDIDRERRRLIGFAVMGVAAAATISLLPENATAATEDAAIRSFRVNVPDEQLADLRRRIAATRWPDRETVNNESQGVQLAKLQELVRYWGTDYDWRKCEARLNALPQFMTTIDDVDIHFIHVRSSDPNALPIIVTHGWPGSVIEQLKIIDPLVNPAAHGASASDAFHVVVPSLPGYGFSGRPTGTGWDPDRIARTWAELMKRLGYSRYVAQGAIGVRRSPARWRGRGRQDCSAFTLICRRPCHPRWRRCSAAGPYRRDSPRRNARCSKHSWRTRKKGIQRISR
jgi:hypothetical protein